MFSTYSQAQEWVGPAMLVSGAKEMKAMSFEEFKKSADEANIIPVYQDIPHDIYTPLGLFLNFENQPNSFLFESLEGGEKWGRYSFIGFGAQKIFTTRGTTVSISEEGLEKSFESASPLDELKNFLGNFKAFTPPDMPRLATGLVGFIGFDSIKFIEDLKTDKRCEKTETVVMSNFPDSFFFLPEIIIVHDNLRQKLKVIAITSLSGNRSLESEYSRAKEKIEKVIRTIEKGGIFPPLPENRVHSIKIEANTTKRDFESAVKRAIEYITSGDCIQIVLSQRFRVELESEPINIYRALRQINPSPYLFYLKMGTNYLLGSSPEILVRLDKDRIQLRPIAGTRPRGKTEEEDLKLEEELLADEKERAEHIMLVDLGRNDVGRVAELGTVKVDELMVVERYSHVMHIVSNVVGKLSAGTDAVDVLKAVFPAGTVSGAPKVRAMEIIYELEKEPRGPYAGAVGYFDFSGNMDFCINIRSFSITGNDVYFQAGAGIVADSDPEREYQETINKAQALIKALEWAYSRSGKESK